jgi:Uma2 family endonuclease
VGRVAERSALSAAEYLEWERQQPVRHEFFRGEVFAMAGGSVRHNALCVNASAQLAGGLRPRGCTVMSSDQRIGIGAGERYVYPDVSVVCGPVLVERGTSDVVANPTILVEVLSASTEQYDRGQKWEGYQRLASLTDYVLVSQAEARIEHFRRGEAGAWIYRAAGPGERVQLSNGAGLVVDVIFDGVFALPADEKTELPSG